MILNGFAVYEEAVSVVVVVSAGVQVADGRRSGRGGRRRVVRLSGRGSRASRFLGPGGLSYRVGMTICGGRGGLWGLTPTGLPGRTGAQRTGTIGHYMLSEFSARGRQGSLR